MIFGGFAILDRPTTFDGKIDASEHIKIYDTLGYFQKKFEDVVDDMVKRQMANEYEQALIARMKALRGVFEREPIDKITEYCLTECRLLAKQMGQVRRACYDLGLKPLGWHGPGAIANAVFKKEKLAKHFGEHIAASNISEQQSWAHHAFVGGRIERLKQGYLKTGALHVYDVASCYPAGIVELPSLAPDQGEWNKLSAEDMRFADLGELLARVEKMSIVSSGFGRKSKTPSARSPSFATITTCGERSKTRQRSRAVSTIRWKWLSSFSSIHCTENLLNLSEQGGKSPRPLIRTMPLQ